MGRSGKYYIKLGNSDSERLLYLDPSLQCLYVCAEMNVIICYKARKETVRGEQEGGAE